MIVEVIICAEAGIGNPTKWFVEAPCAWTLKRDSLSAPQTT